MTGASMPTDAISRARMAPEVYDFTRNFAKSPNILDKAGEMVKGIGRTFQRGIGAGIQADLSEAKTPYRPTSQNYGQRVSENQTTESVMERKGVQDMEIAGGPSRIAEEIGNSQSSHSDSTDVDSNVKKEVQAVAGSVPLTTKEMLQSGGSDNMFTRNLEKTIAGDGMQEIGGEKGGKEKLREFMASGALLSVDPDLEKAMSQSGAPEALEGFKGLLSGRFGDHSQLEGGEDNTGARSQDFAKEVEEVKVNPTSTTTSTNPTTNDVDTFVSLIEGSRTDLFPGRFGGKSMGVSYVPPTNGDAQVTFNFTDKPTTSKTETNPYGDATKVTTGTFGVDEGGIDYLQNQMSPDTFGSYYNRAKKEAKEGKKRQAGEIFGFVSGGDRVIPDQFPLQ
tara:strand:- start:1 stop:1176 length:1176 start_codon:yes stop_codon:yes gene_type:complete